MKKLFLILSLVCSSNLFSQQTIEKCEDNDLTFTYSTQSTVSGLISWSLDSQIFTTTTLTVNWSNYSIGSYQISAIQGEDLCPSNTVYYTVNLIECPNTTMWAPNTFTPDGDEINNVWKPQGYNYFDEHFFIVNRWGQIIFESYNLDYGWDGTYNGKMCQDGVYVYCLQWKDVDNRFHQTYGHITLLK